MSGIYNVGLDLGQAQDYTAIAVVEQIPANKDLCAEDRPTYELRHLERWPLGTAYTQIVPDVGRLMAEQPLRESQLVVDQTGVGRALVDMLRQALTNTWVVPVTITGGQAVSERERGSYHVPKKELVTCLQLLLQSRRLKVAKSLPEARTLVKEMQNFQVRITAAANETFGTWREGQHDDLVLAVALACWWAERHPPWSDDAISTGGESLFDEMQRVYGE